MLLNPKLDPTKKQSKCKTCGEIVYKSDLLKHKLDAHGWKRKVGGQHLTASPLDRIRQHEQEIGKAILELEEERDRLHKRIVEIDNLAAKYKKFNGSNV